MVEKMPNNYTPRLDAFVIKVSDMVLDISPILSELDTKVFEWERDGYKVRIERITELSGESDGIRQNCRATELGKEV